VTAAGLSPEILASLVAVAFGAGLLDAVAGGGGLLTVPALALAGLDPAAAVATNKINGSMGVASASLAFARKGAYRAREPWLLALGAGLGGLAGAATLSYLPASALTAAMPAVLLIVALYFAASPSVGDANRAPRASLWIAGGALAPLVGFYDGAFGPGAGSFYLIICVAALGRSAVQATAETKLANLASNLAGLAVFAAMGKAIWPLGLLMGLAQAAGSALGARAAMRGGARLIRPAIVLVCLAMAGRLAWRAGWLSGWAGG
jgi:hypothetical protein